jgi:hypothetical protein
MKQFLVFGCDMYYPSGGLDDVKGSFDTAAEAVAYAATLNYNFVNIWDRINDVRVRL